MRFITMSVTLLMSLLIAGPAILNLLQLESNDVRSTVRSVQSLAEIAIALGAILVAARACDGFWRQATLVFLVPMAMQQLVYLWLRRNSDLPMNVLIYQLLCWVAPPLVLIVSLYLLPSSEKTNSRSPPVYLRFVMALFASVAFSFSLFSFCIGMDMFGQGLPSLATSLFAIGGSVSASLYALNPLLIHRRVTTIILIATTVALRASRGLQDLHLVRSMDATDWAVTTLVEFAPCLTILIIAMAYPIFRLTVTDPQSLTESTSSRS